MARLVWDATGERLFETGVDHGVLFVMQDNGSYANGVVWNGLTAVNESPEGGEPTALWADNIKYLNLMSTEEFKGSIEAYTYPDEFMACDGSAELVTGIIMGQQARKSFGLAYRTRLGNDVSGSDYGYKIHLVYGALASPSDKGYETINDSPDAITFSWDFSTTPVNVEGAKPTAHIIIDSTKVAAATLASIEDAIFGSDNGDSTLLLPDQLADMSNAPSRLGAPTLAVSGSNITITVAAASNAESFDVYEGNAFVKNIAKTAATTSTAISGLGLDEGEHVLTAKAKAAGYLDSGFSNAVTVTIS